MTYYYVLILNLNLKCIINLLKVKLIPKNILSDITRKDWSSGLRRSASKHNTYEYAGYEFESHSRFFFLPIFFPSFNDFHEMKKKGEHYFYCAF